LAESLSNRGLRRYAWFSRLQRTKEKQSSLQGKKLALHAPEHLKKKKRDPLTFSLKEEEKVKEKK